MFMQDNMLFLKIKSRIRSLSELLSKLGFAWSFILTIGFMVSIIILLSVYNYNSYSTGRDNLRQLQEEKSKLEELKRERARLEEEYEYVQSNKFIETFAQDYLSLAEEGEKIIIIEEEEDIEYTLVDQEEDPIELDNNKYWWQKVFLW
jgi:cell division protein FtsB